MTEAMLAGDIDIAYSQGLAPFCDRGQQGAPLKMVGIAVVYEANDCFVHNDLRITSANASEVEGKTVAVPLNTMADFSFRKQMAALDVVISTLTIVDQVPASAASLTDGSVAMACIFGGLRPDRRQGSRQADHVIKAKKDAGIGSFDVISILEGPFASENPDLVRSFLSDA